MLRPFSTWVSSETNETDRKSQSCFFCEKAKSTCRSTHTSSGRKYPGLHNMPKHLWASIKGQYSYQHVFSCINFCQVPRQVGRSKAEEDVENGGRRPRFLKSREGTGKRKWNGKQSLIAVFA